MKADAYSLYKTLTDPEVDRYTIPLYQRPYTWSKETAGILWDDLYEAYTDYEKAKINKDKLEYYFLGPVVFVKNEDSKSYDIIDGQQRITTFHILFWYLSRRLGEDEKERIDRIIKTFGDKARLDVSNKDASTFLKIRGSNEIINDKSNMAIVANFLNEKISKLVDPNSFSGFLREYTQFIMITADDYNKAWDLFIGLNGKGEPLNPTDLVKAFVCGKTNNVNKIGEIWDETIRPLKEHSTTFLLFVTRHKVKKYISENLLFKEFMNAFESKISEQDLIDFCAVFNKFWLEPVNELINPMKLKNSSEVKKNLRILRDIGRKDITTLLFQVAQEFGDKKIFDLDFLKILSSYQVRMAISGKRQREKSIVTEFKDTVFVNSEKSTEENKERFQESAWKTCLQAVKNYCRKELPVDEEFRTLVRKSSYGSNIVKVILRSHEQGEYGDKVFNDSQIEHLMPQTSTDYWMTQAAAADQESYLTVANNIGNLFVIDKSTNVKARNKNFDEKKKYYEENLKDWSIHRISSSKKRWTKKEIEIRASSIAEWAVKYWKYY